MRAPTERFSDRVEAYVRYRPTYPAEVFERLRNECGMTPDAVVADIGSGPGNLTRPILEAGCEVYGVEPNREMREAGERLLSHFPNFKSVEGTAENTSLPDGSIDLIVAAQAFHWFDRVAARREFMRILKPNGWVALIWNERLTDVSPFLQGYERLLREHAPEYSSVNHADTTPEEALKEFFHPAPMIVAKFPNAQYFDLEGLIGRALSSSYVPQSGPQHEAVLSGLRELFHANAVEGKVAFQYSTQVFYGQLG